MFWGCWFGKKTKKIIVLLLHSSWFNCTKVKRLVSTTDTAQKVSKYGVFSGPYFPALGLNMDRYEASLRIQSESGKTRTRKSYVLGHFSNSVCSRQISWFPMLFKSMLFFLLFLQLIRNRKNWLKTTIFCKKIDFFSKLIRHNFIFHCNWTFLL